MAVFPHPGSKAALKNNDSFILGEFGFERFLNRNLLPAGFHIHRIHVRHQPVLASYSVKMNGKGVGHQASPEDDEHP